MSECCETKKKTHQMMRLKITSLSVCRNILLKHVFKSIYAVNSFISVQRAGGVCNLRCWRQN